LAAGEQTKEKKMKVSLKQSDFSTAVRVAVIVRGRVYLWMAGQPGKRALFSVGGKETPRDGWHDTRLGAEREYYGTEAERNAK